MKLPDLSMSRNKWKTLQQTVSAHVNIILNQSEQPLYYNRVRLVNFNNNSGAQNIFILYQERDYSNSRTLTDIFDQHPEGSSYIVPTLQSVVEDQCLARLNRDQTDREYVIIYTDGQLADQTDFLNLLSNICSKLESQEQLKIIMIGIGLDKNSIISPLFYLKIAATNRFKNTRGKYCNIFGFDLLTEMPNPEDILTVLKRQFEPHPRERLPEWVREWYPEWYEQRFGNRTD